MVVSILQIGPDNIRTNGMAELLVHIGRQEAFAQLRTVEQLGYIVFMVCGTDLNVRNVRFIVQSNTHSTTHLHLRVEALLDKLAKHIEGKSIPMTRLRWRLHLCQSTGLLVDALSWLM